MRIEQIAALFGGKLLGDKLIRKEGLSADALKFAITYALGGVTGLGGALAVGPAMSLVEDVLLEVFPDMLLQKRLRMIKAKLAPVVPEGLVLHLAGDGRGNKILDASVYGNHGTIYDAKWVQTNWGWALEFDGVDDYALVPYSPSLDALKGSNTLSLWVKLLRAPEAGVNKVITGAGAAVYRYRINVQGLNIAFFYSGTDGVVKSMTIGKAIQNTWHHYAIVIDAPALKMYGYSDGILTAIRDVSTLYNADQDVYLGRDSWGGNENVIIGDYHIYNRALSNIEIRFLYENTGPRGVFR